MVTSAIGFRAAARAVSIVADLLPCGIACSANGGQIWVLRLGLYELTRPKQQADDWVWMIDHTIQTGNGKCFLVVGVRLSHWNQKRCAALENDPQGSFALEHEDLTVFAIEHMESSNTDRVKKELLNLSSTTGITPCCILNDQGADVRGGAIAYSQEVVDAGKQSTDDCEESITLCNQASQLLVEPSNCSEQPNQKPPLALHDISHAVANALKHQLHKDDQWTQFLVEANKAKAAIRQTAYAFLMPPELKNKARWMNLDPLITWSRRVRQFLDDPQAALEKANITLDCQVLEKKMDWLRQHADSITRWSALMEVAAITLKYMRNNGYHRQAPEELELLLADFKTGPTEAMVHEILDFVTVQCRQCQEQRLPASTEVLESLIGKGKQLMGSNKNGYTKSVLTMATAVMTITTDTIKQAMAAVKVNDVQQWIEDKLGLSLQAKRQRVLGNLECGTKLG
jgi:hypothetical protein